METSKSGISAKVGQGFYIGPGRVTQKNPLLQFYRWAFPRPKFDDEDLARISHACSDINALTITILIVYVLQNAITNISPPNAVLTIAFFLCYLILERMAIFRGYARAAILVFGLAVGVGWMGLTLSSGTIRHTQSMMLCLGVAYVTMTLGVRKGLMLTLLYSILLYLGTYPKIARFDSDLSFELQMKFVFGAILIMLLMVAICEMLRYHVVGHFQTALTERNNARDELLKANEQLQTMLKKTEGNLDKAVAVTNTALIKQQQFDNMEVMVSGLSHEMGTPVGNAKLAADNLNAWTRELLLKPDLDAQRKTKLLTNMEETCRIIEGNLGRADDLLTSFKRLSLDQTGTNLRDFNLAEAVDRALLSLQPELADVKVQTELDRTITMYSLPYAIEQLVTNFVSNAVRHGLANVKDGLITVTCELVPNKSSVQITVADNGTGIPDDILPMIFNPFFTTRRGRGGQGMGLSVVRHLVEAVLGGTVEVRSNARGSTFLTQVPLKTKESWVAPTAVATSQA